MKTSKSLVLAPAVAVALSGFLAVPAIAAAASPTTTATSEASEAEVDPQITLRIAEITPADIANSDRGVPFYGDGFTPEGTATITVTGTEGSSYEVETKLEVNPEGQISGVYFFNTTGGARVPEGTYSLQITDDESEETSNTTTFQVSSDAPAWQPDDVTTPTESPSTTATTQPSSTPTPSAPSTPTEEATTEPTEEATTEPSSSPTPSASSTPTQEETTEPSPSTEPSSSPTPSASPTPTSESTPTPSASSTPTQEETTEPTETSEPTATGEPTEETSTEAGEEATSEATEAPTAEALQTRVVIDPSEISAQDFSNPDRGVQITIAGAVPGDEITLTVEHAQGRVDNYTATKTADEDGTAVFAVRAIGAAVLGEYQVTVEGEETDAQQGSFTVVTNDPGGSGSGSEGSQNGGGSSGSGSSGSGGSTLPRTGSELTGIALGAGLLVVGAAAIVVTRRRAKDSNGIADI